MTQPTLLQISRPEYCDSITPNNLANCRLFKARDVIKYRFLLQFPILFDAINAILCTQRLLVYYTVVVDYRILLVIVESIVQ